MLPDVNLKSYYLQYISNANSDIVKYKNSLDYTMKMLEELYNYIEENVDAVKVAYSIKLDSYEQEWNKKVYNPSEILYTKVVKLHSNVKDDKNKIILIQIIKYCNMLRDIEKYNKLINLAKIRKNMKFTVYSSYVIKYYNKVHKVVLEGMGYEFSYGIGTYCINHWKIDKDKQTKTKRLDFAATNAKKRELEAKGTRLYNDAEAIWYKERSIPYDAVDYRVYKQESSFYDFTFIKSPIFYRTPFNYKRTEYVSTKYRGMSYTEMADKLCKTYDDIYNLQVDIKYKLNILLHKDPTKYLNFIRNADQCKYKRGAHNS